MKSKKSKFTVGLLICTFIIISLTACGKSKNGTGSKSDQPTPTPKEFIDSGVKIEQGGEDTPQVEEGGETPVDADIEEVRPVTISFVGDIFCGETVYNNYLSGGLTSILSQNVIDVFQQSDIMVVNHEYCSTDIDESNKLTSQTYIEQTPTANDIVLKELGVDLACIANNHMFDYGEQGFIDTLNNLTSLGIKYVGGGMNRENATEAKILKASNKKIAFFAANQVMTDLSWENGPTKPGMNALFTWAGSYTAMVENIKVAKEENDLVVVMVHFGNELENRQNSTQIEYAHAMIDAGADIVIGDHAHVLQGAEYYNNGVIFYGMGNFLFTNYARDTMIVTVTLDVDGTYSIKVMPCYTYLFYTKDVTSSAVFDLLNTYAINFQIDANGNTSAAQKTQIAVSPIPTATPVPQETVEVAPEPEPQPETKPETKPEDTATPTPTPTPSPTPSPEPEPEEEPESEPEAE